MPPSIFDQIPVQITHQANRNYITQPADIKKSTATLNEGEGRPKKRPSSPLNTVLVSLIYHTRIFHTTMNIVTECSIRVFRYKHNRFPETSGNPLL